MPFKRDEDGNVVVATPESGGDSLPIWIDADGNEVPYDPDIPATRLKQARDDKKTLTQRIDSLEEALKSYEGIENPKELLSELEQLRQANAKPKRSKAKSNDEPDDDELNRLSQERDALQRQLESLTQALDAAKNEIETRDSRINRLSVGSEFRTTPWFNPYVDEDGHRRQPKTLLEWTVAEAKFGSHFRPSDNGNDGVVATWTPGGNDFIYSEKDPDKLAPFDEAVGLLLNKWDKKAHYLPRDTPGGMNSRESGGGGGGHMSAAQVESMSQEDYEKKRSEGWAPDKK